MTNATTAYDDEGKPQTLTLEFSKPLLTVGGVDFPTLTLREPTVHEVLRCTATGSAIEQMQALISAVGAIPKRALDNMPVSAYRKAETFLMGFISDGEGDDAPAEGERSDTLTIELTDAIDGRDRIVLAEPTLTMMREAAKAGGALAEQIKLMSLAASCPTDVIDKMRFSDFATGRAFLTGF